MGFNLIKEEALDEIGAKGCLYSHESGCELMHIKCDDQNKVFSITFKTPANDDTGVPHIIEHSVLCGSSNYPIKDPFNELSKGSIHTYLNAMTFKDKTMYPIASFNDKDFFNLMNVYLDAVFNPLLRKEVFLQEGINYENGEFGGIVCNEMQGVYSDPIEIIRYNAFKNLFENNQYAYDTGGLPESIKNLKYESFLSYYKKHYTPSNCYIFLYGNMDIEKCLKIIDEQYLHQHQCNEENAKEEKINIKRANCFNAPKYAEDEHNFSGKKYISANYVVYDANDSKLLTALAILKSYLLGNEASPLKKAIVEESLGSEIVDIFDTNILQPVISIIVKNCNKSVNELKDVLNRVFENILKNGFDDKLLEACLNRYEFSIREDVSTRRPKGLGINISIMTDWIYGNASFEKANKLKPLQEIRNDKGYLLEVLRKYFAQNNFCLYLTLNPKKEIAKKEIEGEQQANSANFNNEQIKQAKEDIKILKQYQDKKDEPKNIEKIPVLKLSDIDNKVEKLDVFKDDLDVPCLRFNLETNGIVYFKFMFDTSKVPQELIPYIGILKYVLGKLRTKNETLDEILTNMGNDLGGFSSSFETFVSVENKNYETLFILSAKALKEKAHKAFEYVYKITETTEFETDEVCKHIESMLKEYVCALENLIINSGDSFSLRRCTSYLQPASKYDELVFGIDFFVFLKEAVEKGGFKEICRNLTKISKMIFAKENLKLYVACNDESFSEIKKHISYYCSKLSCCGNSKQNSFNFKKSNQTSEAFITSSNVQYVSLGFDFSEQKLSYNGHLATLVSILNRGYLIEKVRIEGGAYGCRCAANKKGLFCFSSYRDPNLERTIDVYKNAFKSLENFNVSDREMRKYIIGTINNYISPKSISQKVGVAIVAYLNGVTHEMLSKEADEILNTTNQHISELSQLLSKNISNSNVCVIGNSKKIKSGENVFNSVQKLHN